MSVCLSVHLHAWKRSYYARLPQLLNLTTSKTQQVCETSSIFELDNVKNAASLRDFLIFKVDNIKNEEILRDFLQKLKVECERLRHSATNFLQTIPAPIELENDTCRPQEQDVFKIPTPMELQTDLECPQD